MTWRTFLALDVDDAMRDRLVDVMKRLHSCDAKYRSKLRWRDPAHLHVTVKFLGSVLPPATPLVASRAAEVASRTEPFQINVAGLECVAGARPPGGRLTRIQAIVHDPSGRLTALRRKLDVAVAGLGSTEGNPNFAPHIVIAKVTCLADNERIRRAVAPLEEEDFGTQNCAQIVTYSGCVLGRGAEYATLAQAKLGA
ncbi:MAG: RNA 2',3'-cyclic phosphodiesterase [Phycisphaerae bacterium]|nr:RNA 2',3'-cyclic phosphodiesterase [Phycisphaerae bacterium]